MVLFGVVTGESAILTDAVSMPEAELSKITPDEVQAL